MPLNDLAIRAAKPGVKNYRLSDSPGLYLEVAASGGKWWRFRYHFDGKETRLSLGVYPTVGLKAARMKRDEARQLLDDGVDPGAQRKAKNQVTCKDGELRIRRTRVVREVFPELGGVAFSADHSKAGARCLPLDRIEERGPH
jgi:hypothetical protein